MEYFNTSYNKSVQKDMLKQVMKANADAMYRRAYEKVGNQADALLVIKSVANEAHRESLYVIDQNSVVNWLNELVDAHCNQVIDDRNRVFDAIKVNDDIKMNSQVNVQQTQTYNNTITENEAYKLEEDEWLKELKERRRKQSEQEEVETKNKKGNTIALIIMYLVAAAAIVVLINILSNLGFF